MQCVKQFHISNNRCSSYFSLCEKFFHDRSLLYTILVSKPRSTPISSSLSMEYPLFFFLLLLLLLLHRSSRSSPQQHNLKFLPHHRHRRSHRPWNPGAPEAAYAAMLDTSDFILAASNGSVLWNCFSDPTDTILPTQTLSPGTEIVAKLSKCGRLVGTILIIEYLSSNSRNVKEIK
ncbi:Putative receptor protein kinase ZmPK1 [Dendrobium catenatum]|uniref:Receptor protein kinase ZmPK1 n=1 Tax=Dendrobium catenatum TaxID=906689 RepID=A0A2I0VNV1_9ASPA|nr:Putative receptor protein kinase ZmPK1 [Dendrobium catenatum]